MLAGCGMHTPMLLLPGTGAQHGFVAAQSEFVLQGVPPELVVLLLVLVVPVLVLLVPVLVVVLLLVVLALPPFDCVVVGPAPDELHAASARQHEKVRR
jgi:hypothetical protein